MLLTCPPAASCAPISPGIPSCRSRPTRFPQRCARPCPWRVRRRSEPRQSARVARWRPSTVMFQTQRRKPAGINYARLFSDAHLFSLGRGIVPLQHGLLLHGTGTSLGEEKVTRTLKRFLTAFSAMSCRSSLKRPRSLRALSSFLCSRWNGVALTLSSSIAVKLVASKKRKILPAASGQ